MTRSKYLTGNKKNKPKRVKYDIEPGHLWLCRENESPDVGMTILKHLGEDNFWVSSFGKCYRAEGDFIVEYYRPFNE